MPMNTDLVRPCGECPFRRKSAAGWLGPWDPDVLLLFLGRGVFACHRTIPRNEENVKEEDPRLQACAGAVIFLNNKIERSRHRDVQAYQDKIEGIASKELCSTVFQWGHEFLAHHKGGILAAAKREKQRASRTQKAKTKTRTNARGPRTSHRST